MSVGEYLEPFKGGKYENEVISLIKRAVVSGDWTEIERAVKEQTVFNEYLEEFGDHPTLAELLAKNIADFWKLGKANFVTAKDLPSEHPYNNEEVIEFFSFMIRGLCVPDRSDDDLEVDIGAFSEEGENFPDFLDECGEHLSNKVKRILEKLRTEMPWFTSGEIGRVMLGYITEAEAKVLAEEIEDIDADDIDMEGSEEYLDALKTALENAVENGYGLLYSIEG